MITAEVSPYRHKVELFSAECRLCKTTVNTIGKRLNQMPEVEFVVHKANECVDGKCCQIAAKYGVYAVPSVVIDGRLIKVGVIQNFKEIGQYLA